VESVKGSQRLAALRVLGRVLSERVPLAVSLNDLLEGQSGWVHEVVAGTLRWRGRLDWIIDQFALKKRPTGAIRKCLEMAIYQLLNQPQVEPAWIVSETVDLVRAREGQAASQFVNALLRKVSADLSSWRDLRFPENDLAAQARWASLPDWMWKRIVWDLGQERARDFALRSLERPVTWVRARSAVERAEPGPLPESWRLLEWWPVQESQEYQAGRLFVQDLSSQQLIHDFCAVVGQKGRLLDLCAAPGGKSAGLAWMGWQVTATDRVEGDARYRLLLETASRIESEHPLVVLPRKQAIEAGPYDAVWVDAPCTGSGVVRRHPEIRWLKDEKDLFSLQKLQRELVSEALTCVRPGGWFMYTVCSVLRDELLAAQEGARVAGLELIREWVLFGDGDGFSGLLFRKPAGLRE
jgi:16S rRNA (cytosine967-C5)-methyltransferase